MMVGLTIAFSACCSGSKRAPSGDGTLELVAEEHFVAANAASDLMLTSAPEGLVLWRGSARSAPVPRPDCKAAYDPANVKLLSHDGGAIYLWHAAPVRPEPHERARAIDVSCVAELGTGTARSLAEAWPSSKIVAQADWTSLAMSQPTGGRTYLWGDDRQAFALEVIDGATVVATQTAARVHHVAVTEGAKGLAAIGVRTTNADLELVAWAGEPATPALFSGGTVVTRLTDRDFPRGAWIDPQGRAAVIAFDVHETGGSRALIIDPVAAEVRAGIDLPRDTEVVHVAFAPGGTEVALLLGTLGKPLAGFAVQRHALDGTQVRRATGSGAPQHVAWLRDGTIHVFAGRSHLRWRD